MPKLAFKRVGWYVGVQKRNEFIEKELEKSKNKLTTRSMTMGICHKIMKTAEEKAERYANLMIAVAVIAGVYFVVWALIGLVL